ncbi:MAG: GreA/GreB family elongation factor [Mycobacterium sp.]
MTSTEFVGMTRQRYTRLQNELAALRSRRTIEVPEDFLDYDANLLARHSARQARVSQIQDLLATAVVDGELAGDPVAEPGMVLTIGYDDTGEAETFLLGSCGAEGADMRVYSMASPLGRAIAGARPGDRRVYSLPNETGRLVMLLEAVPYGMHVVKSPGPQAAYRDTPITRRHY